LKIFLLRSPTTLKSAAQNSGAALAPPYPGKGRWSNGTMALLQT